MIWTTDALGILRTCAPAGKMQKGDAPLSGRSRWSAFGPAGASPSQVQCRSLLPEGTLSDFTPHNFDKVPLGKRDLRLAPATTNCRGDQTDQQQGHARRLGHGALAGAAAAAGHGHVAEVGLPQVEPSGLSG